MKDYKFGIQRNSMTNKANLSDLSVKNLKNVKMGPEGGAFTASLYEGSTRVAHVSYDGWGGCYRYEWTPKGKDREDPIHAAAKAKHGGCDPLDLAVSELVDDFETKKLCRKEVLFRLASMDYSEGEYTVYKGKYTPELAVRMRAHYEGKGDKVTMILNEQFA